MDLNKKQYDITYRELKRKQMIKNFWFIMLFVVCFAICIFIVSFIIFALKASYDQLASGFTIGIDFIQTPTYEGYRI